MSEDVSSAMETPHQGLRRSTADAHERTEALLAPFDLTEREGLAAFLGIHAAVVLPLEEELDHRDFARLVPDWPLRRRGEALLQDLATLDRDQPAPASRLIWTERLPTDNHLLGACYVLEGSRLGGTILKRRVQLSPDPLVRDATRYLGHVAAPGAWRHFLARLDMAPPDPATSAALRDGALAVFKAFADAAECHATKSSG